MSMNFTINFLYFTENSPYVERCAVPPFQPSNRCRYPGLGVEPMFAILSRLQYPFVLSRVPENLIELYGEVDAKFMAIEQTENSCAVPYFHKTEARLQNYKLTMPIYRQDGTAVYSIAETPTLFSFLSVFDLGIWIALLIYFVLFRLFLEVLTMKQQSDQLRVMKSRRIARKLRGFYGSGVRIERKFAWMTIFAALFIYLYRSGLLSSILITHQASLFTNYDDLAEKIAAGSIRMVSFENDAWAQRIGEDQLQALRPLARALQYNPALITKDHAQAYKAVQNGNNDRVLLSFYIDALYMTAPLLDLKSVELPPLASFDTVILCNPSVPDSFMHHLNRTIQELQPNFYVIYDRYKYVYQLLYDRRRNEVIVKNVHAIRLDQIIGGIALLVFGLMSAFVCWAIEMCFKHCYCATVRWVRYDE